MRCRAFLFYFPLLAAAVANGRFAPAAEPDIDFNRDIRPILSENCFQCHGPDAATRHAGLRLDLAADATSVLDSGARAIAPGKSGESELLARVKSADPATRMPPEESGKSLKPEQTELLARWIDGGAEYQEHWSWLPPVRPVLPNVRQIEWPRNPIDHFVLSQIEQANLEPSEEADPATLLRRVTLDLTGLPPTPADIERFLADPSPDAYEREVDRLLASPHHGERMALDWLDAARYADTNGYNNDEPRVMWPWRDWVIAAFNRGLPFDQFAVEQLAGDLLPNPSLEQQVATGFNRNHVLTTEGGIIEEEYRVEYVADRVHTTSTVFLGLSLQCARCHDHKFDPLTQRDYFRFFAYFNQIADTTQGYSRTEPLPPIVRLPSEEQTRELEQLQAERERLAKLVAEEAIEPPAPEPETSPASEPPADGTRSVPATDNQTALTAIEERIKAVEAAVPKPMVMQDIAQPRETRMLNRGQYDQPGEAVTTGVPASLPPLPEGAAANRLALAKWIVDSANPLTARVAVNRWWRMAFGEGLVETVEDFGSQGARPTHPELLDWLADELVARDWNVKSLLRTIVTSATYRQTSHASKEQIERDPANRLLARGPRHRLPAEAIRDAALAASGLLVETIGGPSVMPYQPAGLWEDVSVERRYVYTPDSGAGLYRRGMYTFWKRTCPPPAMTSLDAPDRESCVARRARTNTPLQALILLNDPTYVEAARMLAEQMLAAPSDAERIDSGAMRALARPATSEEHDVLLGLLASARQKFQSDAPGARGLLEIGASRPALTLIADDAGAAELAAWTVVASTLLNLDEAISKH
jgi:hypothetical protein